MATQLSTSPRVPVSLTAWVDEVGEVASAGVLRAVMGRAVVEGSAVECPTVECPAVEGSEESMNRPDLAIDRALYVTA